MTGRIEHWRRTYRVPRTPAGADRLDRLAGGPVLAAYEAALQRAHGDPAEVILVREVSARLVLPPGDEQAARWWGEGMAAAVLRAVAAGAGTDAVVRLPDRAAHAAAFAAAVAAGRPADDWYFARFAPLRRGTAGGTVLAALLADREACPAVLARLAETGNLPRVLRLIGPRGAAEVWGAVAGSPPPPDADRPLFAAALGLLLQLGGASVSAARAAAWFAEFAATHTPADWRDRASLADAVAAAVRFLAARRRPVPRPSPEELDRAAAGLDWLDTARLRGRLEESFAAPPGPAAARPRRARRAPGLSPRQAAWVAAVRAALPSVLPHLDRSDPPSRGNAVLVYAALAAANPAWRDDPALPGFVDQLLAAAADVAPAPARPGSSERPAAGDAPDTRRFAGTAADAVRAPATPPALAEGCADVLSALAGLRAATAPARGPEAGPVAVETRAAGVFLLARAVRDLRLAALAGRTRFPAAGGRWLLAALAAKWAGLAFDADPAPALFAAPDQAPDGAAFRAAWADAGGAADFQAGLARTLAGQGLLPGGALHVWVADDSPIGPVALGGNEAGTVWPFAAPVGECAVPDLAGRWVAAGGAAEATAPGPAPAAAVAALELFSRVAVGDPLADATLTAAAQATVRAWARWLRQFHGAGTGYLLDQFVRRPGRVQRDDGGLLVELDPRPVDVVLRLSGYLDAIEPLPRSGEPRIRFALRGGG